VVEQVQPDGSEQQAGEAAVSPVPTTTSRAWREAPASACAASPSVTTCRTGTSGNFSAIGATTWSSSSSIADRVVRGL